MRFVPGEVALRRYWRGGQISFLNVTRVVADNADGLRLWLPAGAPYWRLISGDGRTQHDAPIDRLNRPRLRPLIWRGSDVLVWMEPTNAYSVWWLWGPDGTFTGWYVNFEEPFTRWADPDCVGVDSADQALDLVVAPDRTWRWKDEAEFDARTGHPLYWDAREAAEVRATGERVVQLIEAGQFPFDRTWCGYRPDPAWTVPSLPPGFDRPRAVPAGVPGHDR